MMFEDEEAPGLEQGAPDAATERATTTLVAHPRQTAGRTPPRISHPPAYRGVVAGWPEDWRERWGRRANELEEAGLPWREAESKAFVEVWRVVREGRLSGAVTPSRPDPDRN